MPLVLVLGGVALVVGGILAFRLHAFLALLLGALTIALLTPATWVERSAVRPAALNPAALNPAAPSPAAVETPATVAFELPASQAFAGLQLVVLRSDEAGPWREVGRLRVTKLRQASPQSGTPAAVLCVAHSGAAWQDGDLVLTPTAWAAIQRDAGRNGAERVAVEFGKVCGSIGILIALAALVGRALLDSGAADRIVRSTLALVGIERAPLALAGSGFLLGIPVFFDTVFYLLLPLAKATRRRSGGNYALYVLAIVCGATMTHSLVPPTPGPLLAAQGFKVDLGTMIVGGLLVGAVTSTVGLLFASWVTRDWELAPPAPPGGDDEETAAPDEATLPPLLLAVAPILLPIVLMAGATALTTWKQAVSPAAPPDVVAVLLPWAALFGQKDLAMALATAVALGTYLAWRRPTLAEFARLVEQELGAAGGVILITAAGGALGGAITQTGIAETLRIGLTQVDPLWVLPIAFAVTAAIRTAQGSATVAMITAVGMFAPFAEPGLLPFHPVYLALVIGCGSKPLSWMADSGFWVISRMSGFSEWETLQTVTPQLALMGLAGLVTVWLAAWLWPLV